ncbi:MAG: protein translocase subunit SecD [Parahaliea sp.]
MKSLRFRAVVYGLLIMLGLLSALPNTLSSNLSDKLPDWYRHNTVSLGLDLQGGSHLLLAADSKALINDALQATVDNLTSTLHESGISARVAIKHEQIELSLHKPDQVMTALKLARELAHDTADAIRHFDIEQDKNKIIFSPTRSWQQNLTKDAIERSLEVVRRRLDESGLVEPSITRQGNDGILVQMPGLADPGEIRKLLGTTAKLSFHWVVRPTTATTVSNTMTVADVAGQPSYRLERRAVMTGEHIEDAQMSFNANTRQPVVTFKLDHKGAQQFSELTRANIGRALAIVLDNKVLTAPVIRGAIAGNGEISGNFTATEATHLALLLRAGALPVPLQVVEERTVGPDLGSDTIAMGLGTGLLGAAMVIAFMLAIYGRWGLIACLGLSVNIGLIFGILSLLGATLTLPGIAGIILTIGMAVDANILINERIREEARTGKSARIALQEGFDRAYGTILDSNLTTLIAVSLLFSFGSGPVKGFAVTIGIGLLTSMFTAIAVTRLMMEWSIRKKGRQPLHIAGIRWLDGIGRRNINFLRGRFVGLALSGLLSIASIILFIQPGLQYGVDFTGGTMIEVSAPNVTVEHLRSSLQASELAEAAIQEFGNSQFMIRLPAEPEQPGKTAAQVEALKSAVIKLQADASFPRVDMVGPKVSGDFSDVTILAILSAGAGMLAYLWFRFESHFALAATLTIALDLTKTIGFFALTGVEFNLTAVAALLALMGYSINDKVVVFDRVRENLRRNPDKDILALLNESISSTLSRTVFTSTTSFLALLPMGIAGGAAVASFALPMLFGIVIGTSSSIFIASPILYFLSRRRIQKGLAQLRPTSDELDKELALLP